MTKLSDVLNGEPISKHKPNPVSVEPCQDCQELQTRIKELEARVNPRQAHPAVLKAAMDHLRPMLVDDGLVDEDELEDEVRALLSVANAASEVLDV